MKISLRRLLHCTRPPRQLLAPFGLLLISLTLSGCQILCAPPAPDYPLIQQPSENANGRVRALVIHFTSLNWADSLRALTQPGQTRVSAHYLIPESGDASYSTRALAVYQLVDENRRAWHAGASRWEDRVDLNDQSVGIELVNVSRCTRTPDNAQRCDYPPYDPTQIDLLIRLAKDILKRHPDISPTRVVGHGDIAPTRRVDPGPHFPWKRLYEHGIGAWYDDATLEKYLQRFSAQPISLAQLRAGLSAYGYGIPLHGEMDALLRDVLQNFQGHFLPEQVDREMSLRTQAVLFALLEKYFPDAARRILESPQAG